MKKRLVLGVGLAMAVLMGGLVFTACDDDEEDTTTSGVLSISPASVTIPAGVNTNLIFVASGGTTPYTWSVSSSIYGTLVASGSQAIYSSTAMAGRNYVTVTDSFTNSITATIDHN